MNKIQLANTGEFISRLGLGTMYFGSKVTKEVSFDLLDFFVNHGGTFIDSANKYASWIPGCEGGESEATVGKWLKLRNNRSNLFISSKVGFAYGNIPRSLKKEIIISECERSLKRLQIDYIDLYFAHAFDENTLPEETMQAFLELKKSGKIRFAGASNFQAWRLFQANEIAKEQSWEGFCCVQQRHTFLEPTLRANFGTQLLLTPEMLDFCKNKNITIMAYSPLLGGIYGKNDIAIPVQYQNAATEFRMVKLKEVSEAHAVSANAVVLAWMLQSSPAIIPLVTGSSLAQIEENMQALNIRLTDKQLDLLNMDVIQPNKY